VVVPHREATLAVRIMGTVQHVAVREGEAVSQGQVLLSLDDQVVAGQEAQAGAMLAQARAALDLARKNRERFDHLARHQAAAELELDRARLALEQAQAAVRQAEGALASARSMRQDGRIVAPFDGWVRQRMVEVGDLASPGRPLLVLESRKGRYLQVSLPERLVLRGSVKTGTTCQVAMEDQPGLDVIRGRIAEVSSGADPMTHTYRVKVDLDADSLPTGQTASLLMDEGGDNAILVPRSALMHRGEMTLVVVRNQEGKTENRVISVGREEGDQVEVLSGLKGGETLLVDLPAPPASGLKVEEVV